MISSLALINAKAVSLMECGMHQEAVRSLSAAVKQCASALFDFQSQPVSPRDVTSCSDLIVSTSIPLKGSSLAQQPDMEIFTSPFIMLLNNMREKRQINQNKSLLAGGVALCFYNMGLACHLEWLQRSRNDSRVLNQAHSFYAKAYSTLQLCQLKSTDSLLVLLMAISTNLISVNMELGQLATVNNLKDNLTSVISYADLCQFGDDWSFRQLCHATMLFRTDLVAARAA